MSFSTASPQADTAPPPAPAPGRVLQRKCSCGGSADSSGECEECKKKKMLQRKPLGGSRSDASVDSVLSTPGSALDTGTRSFLESGFAGARPRVAPSGAVQGKLAISPTTDPAEAEADSFADRALSRRTGGAPASAAPDLSSIRIHTDSAASASAASVGARAYTVGNHIVFGSGQFDQRSTEGRRLIAHEAAHVLQQSAAAPVIQRDACTTLRTDIEAHKVYKDVLKSGGDPATEAKEVLDMAQKGSSCVSDLTQFKLLFDTPDLASGNSSSPATQASREQALKDTRLAGANSKAAEDTRLASGEGKARKGEEESAPSSIGWRDQAGNDGTTYRINTTDYRNIQVRAKVKLSTANASAADAKLAANAADVTNIEGLEDGIEKVASTLGYSLDLTFMTTSGPDVFEANVDLGEWTNSGNWVGKRPTEDIAFGLGHELHHRLGLRDRYNYMTHASNETMKVVDRIHWFHFQMGEGGVDPLDNDSLMGSGMVLHPDDICRIAVGLKGDRKAEDDKKLAADAGLNANFKQCLKERSALPADKAKPAQDAAAAACDNALTHISWATMGSNLSFGYLVPYDPAAVALKLTGKTLSLAQLTTEVTNIKAQTRMAVSVTSNRAKVCDGNDGASTGGKAPVLLCPTFFTASLADQTTLILRHAAALATSGSPKRADACAAYDCTTNTGKDADPWVHFIKCV